MEGIYCFAGVRFLVNTVTDAVHQQCEAYRISGTDYDCSIQTDPDSISRERELSAREDVLENRGVHHYADDYLESLAVYRKIAETLPFYHGFLFHGSALAVDGQAYIFAAPSGTGKSTHARLWRELLGERAVMVNDDKPLIRIEDNCAVVYGTPWDGKHHLSRNAAFPLKAICFLQRAEGNSIREISRHDAFPALLRQTYMPANPAALSKTLGLLDRMQVCYYMLSCNMELQAAELAYHTMRGEKE